MLRVFLTAMLLSLGAFSGRADQEAQPQTAFEEIEISNLSEGEPEGVDAGVLVLEDKSAWAVRVGLPEGVGAEYVHDLNPRWQTAFHAASWIIFSEVGGDIRYFFKRTPTSGYYLGSGLKALNSPLLFAFAGGFNMELGFEKVTKKGFYLGAGAGLTAYYVPHGLPAEGHGYQGIAPAISIRIGKIKPKKR